MVGQEWRGSERNNGEKVDRARARKKSVHTTSMLSMLVTANTFELYVRETSGTEECGRGSVQ
jgi:hypothetical protein